MKNRTIHDVWCKAFRVEKPLCIRFDEIDGFIKIYDRVRYLLLFGYERYDEI